ncbi:MAG TPA: CBS domain-containing protein [Vicinamibacterales bacterium]|nr:CBS domain-containing protein [Vicinamibacterales bacterium]
MNVRDIMMQPAVSCGPDTDLAHAAQMMQDRRLGSLPVVDDRHSVIGMLTDRDVALAVATHRRNTTHVAVREVMTAAVHCCGPDETVAAALARMAAARVVRLPVVDTESHLTGILSIDDIIQRAIDEPGGVPARAFVDALIRISARSAVEAPIEFADKLVSG